MLSTLPRGTQQRFPLHSARSTDLRCKTGEQAKRTRAICGICGFKVILISHDKPTFGHLRSYQNPWSAQPSIPRESLECPTPKYPHKIPGERSTPEHFWRIPEVPNPTVSPENPLDRWNPWSSQPLVFRTGSPQRPGSAQPILRPDSRCVQEYDVCIYNRRRCPRCTSKCFCYRRDRPSTL